MMFNPNQPNEAFACNFLFEVANVGMKKPKIVKLPFNGNLENFQDQLHNYLLKMQEKYFFVKCFVELPNGDKNEVDVY